MKTEQAIKDRIEVLESLEKDMIIGSDGLSRINAGKLSLLWVLSDEVD